MAGNSRVVIRKAAMEQFAQSDEMAHMLVTHVDRIKTGAQGRAPVSSSGSHGRRAGYLQKGIRTKYGKDRDSVFGDVITTARTPKGFPYGKYQNELRSYLKPTA